MHEKCLTFSAIIKRVQSSAIQPLNPFILDEVFLNQKTHTK